MTESQIYAQLLKGTIINNKETNWLVKEGYLGEYDPSYITNKAELFITEFENKRIDKVVGYISINGSITTEKLRDIVTIEPDAFDVFVARLVKKQKILKKKPGNIYVLKKPHQ